MYDAEARKRTQVLFFGGPFQTLARECNHEKQWWQDKHKSWYKAAHKKTAGEVDGNGKWATNSLSAYPENLNRRLACCIAMAGGSTKRFQ